MGPELDFEVWKTVTKYESYTEQSQAITWLWEILDTFNADEKKDFLMFCTGCDRAPVGGLRLLPFVVARAGPDSDQMPTVHTCFNHLLLPDYTTKGKMERLLRKALEHCTGFGLM